MTDTLGDDIDAIRGTRTFEGVLYSRENAKDRIPVDVLTGEKTVGVSPEEKAKRFAEETTPEDGYQRVAVPQTTEAMIETQSAPYVSVAFFNPKVVRGKVIGTNEFGQSECENDGGTLARAYRAAIQSDAYEVELVATDYQTGDVTIRVEEGDDR